MIYTKGLLLKGLLGFGATSSAVYVGLSQQERIAEFFSGGKETEKPAAITTDASKLLEKVGLECNGLESVTAEGVVCSKKADSGNIKVKKGESIKFEVSNLSSTPEGAKLKVYKDEGQGEDAYNQGLKFVIEGGDISASAGDKKLEEFETYEIKQDGADWKLILKKKSSEEKKRILGLDSCTFPEGAAGQSTSCELTTEKISKIKFDGKTDAAVEGSGNLQITIAPSNSADFPHGFKFTLTSTSGNITIPRSTELGNIVVKNNEGTDFRIKKVGKNLTLEEALTKDALTKKVGLQCQGEPSTTGIDCTKVDGSNIKVKQGETSFNVTTAPSGDSKIKLYKDDGYDNGLKFVIEGGNISGENTNKLEEFETYEIKKDGTDWKLTRKKKSWEEKRRILGLPGSCTFPEGASGSANCTINTSDVSSINFDGKTGATLEGGSATLKVEVTPSTETADFPHGFKFTLTPSSGSTLTINKGSENITLSSGTSKEFKIKKQDKSLSLEEAWTLEKLASKVGLSCTASGGAPSGTDGVNCTKSNGNIKVKKAENTSFEVSSISDGKIKVYKTSSGETHNEGFKFVIEENDISGANGGTSGNKLEQFETYEIKKDSSEWKLVKKTDAKDGIKDALGLDRGCDFPTNETEKECALDDAKFKKIKFSAGDSERGTAPANIKLKISKPSGSTDYGPFGYKFVLDSSGEAKISSSLTIAGNTNTEFKIKRQTNSNNITLEKALDVVTLGKKVNLTCTAGNGTKDCTLGSGSTINVKDGTNTRKQASFQNGDDGSEKKLTYELDQKDYNQGIKFTTLNAITLQNGDSTGNPTSIENNGATYEIKEDGGTWYLTKKN